MKELIEIQGTLNAPKGQYNAFGKYRYRSCEDILAAVKPLLRKHGCVLLLSDEVREVGAAYTHSAQDTKKGTASSYSGTRVYIEATATIINSAGERFSVKASAREEVAKAGMDASQVTGAASSYARKYALNGLFAIDDAKDADALGTSVGHAPRQAQGGEMTPEEIFQWYAAPDIQQAATKEDLARIYNDNPSLHAMRAFIEALTARRKALGIRNSNEK